MSKRSAVRAFAVVMVASAVVIGFFAYKGTSRKFEFSTEEVQTRINASLGRRALEDHAVNVESAKILFRDDRIVIDATASGRLKNRQVQAQVHAVGTPDYRGGAFYFLPTEKPVFSNVKIEKVDSKPGAFDRTRALIKKRAEQFITEHNYEDILEAYKDDFREWTLRTAEAAVKTALTKHAIYTPKNDLKGFLIKAAVEKVEVVGDKLVVTISLVQILYSIFIAVALLLAAVAVFAFIVMNPEWGIALVILPSL